MKTLQQNWYQNKYQYMFTLQLLSVLISLFIYFSPILFQWFLNRILTNVNRLISVNHWKVEKNRHMFHVANCLSLPSWIGQKKALIARQIFFTIVQKENGLYSCGNFNAAIDFRSRLLTRFVKFRHHFRLRLFSRNRERKGPLSLKHH